VAVYGLGLPSFVLQKALQPLFFAREDTRRPFYFALASLAVNAVIAVGLMPYLGFIAAAIGTTMSGWASVALLWVASRRMGVAATTDRRFRARVWRILLASALMGALLWVAAQALGPFLDLPTLRYGALAVLVGTGLAGYFGIGQIVGAFQLSDIRAALRR